jgi:putative transposase
MQQIRTYRFKPPGGPVKPTQAQAQSFAQWLGSCRYVYNLCLDYKKQPPGGPVVGAATQLMTTM